MKLIADSGSTKTAWVVLEKDSPRFVNAKGINPMIMDQPQIVKVLENIDFGLSPDAVSEITFYGAGCSTPHARSLVSGAMAEVFTNATIHVEHDLLGAANAIYDGQPVMSCILGTGSNICYFDGTTLFQTLPSLGHYLGDEGSGSYIGKALLRGYFYGTMPEDIRERFVKEFDITLSKVLKSTLKEPFPNRYVAQFAIFAGKHLENPWINGLIKSAFSAFLDLLVIPQMPSKEIPISFVGSIAFGFKKPLQEVVEEKGLVMGVVIKDPIEGLAKNSLANE